MDRRVEANNAMVALLAGAPLAAHSLSLHTGTRVGLQEMYPGVRHISRFDLPVEKARLILDSAESHIAAVAVPYALALQEGFLKDVRDWLSEDFDVEFGKRQMQASSSHEILFSKLGFGEPKETLGDFHVLREMRNAHAHAAGKFDDRLLAAVNKLSVEQRGQWEKLNDKSLDDLEGIGEIRFNSKHVIKAFAVVKSLGRSINLALQDKLSQGEWEAIALADYSADRHGRGVPKQSSRWDRALSGYIERN